MGQGLTIPASFSFRKDRDMDMSVIATFTITEFRAFRKALLVLLRAGIERQTAIDILLSARAQRHEQLTRFRRA